jgi:mannose-6-phosphate isomerase-like protein (cupin superfamily)
MEYPMSIQKIIIKEKFTLFDEQWSPKIIAQLNDYHFKIAKIEGEFVWHSHAETDEVFIVIDGEFKMQLREGNLTLKEGEMCVIPKGVEHKPVAEKECAILMVELAGTLNTGDAGGEHTIEELDWI